MSDGAPLLLDATRLIWRRWAGRAPTGIDRVCLAYLRRFAPASQAVIQHRRFRRILDREASTALFRLLGTPPENFRTAFLRSIARHLRPFGSGGEGRLYLNIGHTGLDDPGLRTWIAKAEVAPVYFVHDLIPLTHPNFCRAGEADRHRERMRTVLQTASGVIANSQATIDDLHHFASSEGLRFPPAVAAWLGVPHLDRPAMAAPTGGQATFVVLGTIEARKNHSLLLDVWARLIDRLGTAAPRLLIIGQRGWEADDIFRRLDSDERLKGYVDELNGCSDRELASHLANARALLFPSHAEGFGLPLIEALALGTPVIASDLPALREIGQGVPLFLPSNEAAAWEAAILDFSRPESAERAVQVERLRHFRVPDWETHFATVAHWLTKLHPGQDVRSLSR